MDEMTEGTNECESSFNKFDKSFKWYLIEDKFKISPTKTSKI